ncbi:hypothetical protein [Allonocardiopsis opalescens]|uniref:Uncharacterized protein n=1 Tax=Allonocardiopsis opalescens TaxID=1144618 RepID=A0A2T0Q7G1_9ACTN|nr:hypothetical protein [Allonocardiopsis opalescens]PRX99775.1 hypothetical protein CLV72_103381 [Allonocardiopsis opalescens]
MAILSASPWALIVLTLDLVRRYWAPMLLWYALGQLLHDLFMQVLILAGEQHRLLGYAGLSLSILITLVAMILMFHAVRPGLPTLQSELRTHRRPVADLSAFDEEEHNVIDAVAQAILPFLIFYGAWNLIADEVREYGVGFFNSTGNLDILGDELNGVAFGIPMAVAIGAWLARWVFENLYNRSHNRWLGITTAVFESVWTFFALFTVAQLIGDFWTWLGNRVFVQGIGDAVQSSITFLDGLVPFELNLFVNLSWDWWLVEIWPYLKDGLLQPILWLTIAAVVFGAEISRNRALIEGTGRLEERIDRLSSRIPRSLRWAGVSLTRDLQDKYTPFLNAFRFVLRTGMVFYLSYCLIYTLLEIGMDWLYRGVLYAMGPHDFLEWWWNRLPFVEFGVDALHEILRVCLLAAAFELTLRRVGHLSRGRRSKGREKVFS